MALRVAIPYGVGEIEAAFASGRYTVRIGDLAASGCDLESTLAHMLDEHPIRVRPLAAALHHAFVVEVQTCVVELNGSPL